MHTTRSRYNFCTQYIAARKQPSIHCKAMAAKLFLRSVCILSVVYLASTSAWSGRRESRDTHDHDDHFVEIGNYLVEEEIRVFRKENDFAENPNQNVTFEEMRLLAETIFGRVDCAVRVDNCSKCANDFAVDVFAAIGIETTYGFNEEGFLRASPLLLYGTYELVSVCQAGGTGTDLSEDAVFLSLSSAGRDGSNDTLSEEDLSAILDSIANSYTEELNSKCFNVESVFDETVSDHDTGANDVETRSVAEVVIAGLLQGYCIGEATLPTTESFTDAIFDSYSTSDVITEEGFEEMLTALGIGGSTDHDHAHERRRSVATDEGSIGRSLHRRAMALDDHHDDHDHPGSAPNVTQTCFTGEDLLDIYGIDHEAGITEAQFNELSPSLVQQILSGACSQTGSTPSSITTAQIWGYGTLAVALISLLSLVGGLFIPCMSEGVYEKTIQTMIALAVATLTADAILHLLPQAVGLHGHEEEGGHAPTSPELAYVWKCLVIECAIYVFFLFEQVTNFTTCCAHSHSHSVGRTQEQHNSIELSGPAGESQRTSSFRNGRALASSESHKNLKIFEEGIEEPDMKDKSRLAGCNPVAIMIILGDSLHNFGDGLAIGAAFTLSIAAGLSTTIAVMCHELPHELGDLAVLLNQGMRLSTALLLNMFSACTAFLGLWIGIPLAQAGGAREWIFAAVAGMFLYVGLVDMLPILHNYQGKSNKATIAFLQNFGFLLGIGIMLVIALYEDSITFAF